jgi:2-haloacid dehalogenase
MAVRAVLFDYGNVLVRWDPRHLYRKIFADPAEMEMFLGRICTMAWHAENDRGAHMDARLAPLIAAHPDREPQIRAFSTRYGEMIDGEIAGSIALLDRLAARGVRLAMLTNMPGDKIEECFAPFTRRPLFDPIVISGLEEVMKPEPRVYQIALDRLGMAPGEVFFTDDSPRNVEGAARVGLRAHLFESPEGLEAALAAEGLLG